MFYGNEVFQVNSKVSWRKDKLGNKNIILIGVPQTHSLYVLEKVGIEIWLLCCNKKTFNEITKSISKNLHRNAKNECERFIQMLVDKNIISPYDKKN